MANAAPVLQQTWIGVGLLVAGGVMGAGAVGISGEAGYGGVGPNFLPWVVSLALLVCGAAALWQARTGGFRHADEPSGAQSGDWHSFAWVSAGLLLNAAAITSLGFILSCTLCFALAVHGLRRAAHEDAGGFKARVALKDCALGLAICAPVYWTFSKLLGINLPGLTSTGWL